MIAYLLASKISWCPSSTSRLVVQQWGPITYAVKWYNSDFMKQPHLAAAIRINTLSVKRVTAGRCYS